MGKFNKKGVSEVVANVLIVLLVIVGVAVIWSVVKPTIDKGAKGIQSDCFTLSVEPVKCVILPIVPTSIDVTVKRNPGLGVFNAVEVIFENANGLTEKVVPATIISSTGTNPLGELGTKVINVGATLTGITKANIVLRDGNGNLCQVISQPINCA